MACTAYVYYLKKDFKEEEKGREMDDRALIRKGVLTSKKLKRMVALMGLAVILERQLNQRHQELQSDHQTHA